jgi:hypothetical protein
MVRAFNVLRQYEEGEVDDALTRLARYVLPGGLLVEGTSDPTGRLWTANVLRRAASEPAWRREALVFSTNFRSPFAPGDFQAVLPKNLIHRVIAGEAIFAFFAAWKQAALETAAFQAWGRRAWFVAAAHWLATAGYQVNTRPSWLRRGFLIVQGTGFSQAT